MVAAQSCRISGFGCENTAFYPCIPYYQSPISFPFWFYYKVRFKEENLICLFKKNYQLQSIKIPIMVYNWLCLFKISGAYVLKYYRYRSLTGLVDKISLIFKTQTRVHSLHIHCRPKNIWQAVFSWCDCSLTVKVMSHHHNFSKLVTCIYF